MLGIQEDTTWVSIPLPNQRALKAKYVLKGEYKKLFYPYPICLFTGIKLSTQRIINKSFQNSFSHILSSLSKAEDCSIYPRGTSSVFVQ